MAVANPNSYRNKGFPNEPDVGYRNFFIPWVEKNVKISTWDEEISIPILQVKMY